LLVSPLFEEYLLDEVTYEVIKSPDKDSPLQEYIVDVTITFCNKDITCLDLFKEKLLKTDTRFHFVEDPTVLQMGDKVVVNMKVSG
jgi:hypothetical protein